MLWLPFTVDLCAGKLRSSAHLSSANINISRLVARTPTPQSMPIGLHLLFSLYASIKRSSELLLFCAVVALFFAFFWYAFVSGLVSVSLFNAQFYGLFNRSHIQDIWVQPLFVSLLWRCPIFSPILPLLVSFESHSMWCVGMSHRSEGVSVQKIMYIL